MSVFRFFLIVIIASVLVTGCAKPPEPRAVLGKSQQMPAPVSGTVGAKTTKTAASSNIVDEELTTASIGDTTIKGNLAGRVLKVADVSDIKLRQGEVILTFDDGPAPQTTPLVLAALKSYDVKATFFMVGSMAKAHVTTARAVARAGHTIGSHTHGHENLANLDTIDALRAVANGENEVARAIAPTGKKVAPFFRFPYLAQTGVLRADLSDLGVVVFDVDIDSLDFKKQTSDEVLARTLARLDQKGKGIVLFHDIHRRTAGLLPAFLNALDERGYKVVQAVPKHRPVFETPLLAALD